MLWLLDERIGRSKRDSTLPDVSCAALTFDHGSHCGAADAAAVTVAHFLFRSELFRHIFDPFHCYYIAKIKIIFY